MLQQNQDFKKQINNKTQIFLALQTKLSYIVYNKVYGEDRSRSFNLKLKAVKTMTCRRQKTSSVSVTLPATGRAGVTLLELIVALAAFAAIVTIAIVNWTSFVQYQNLRQEAHSFHKDLVAMRARALENGDSVAVHFTGVANGYNVYVRDSTGWAAPVRTVRFTSNLTHSFGQPADNLPLAASFANNWGPQVAGSGGATGSYDIMIRNENIAYDNGWVTLRNNRDIFCVIVNDDQNIRPELFHTKIGSNSWQKK